MKKVYLLVCLVFFGTLSFSQTLYEDFNYTVGGNIGGNTAGTGTTNNNWTTHSNSLVGTINVLSGSLSYTGLQASTGNRVAIPGANGTTSRDVNRGAGLGATNTVVYYSFLVNIVNATQLGATHGTNGYFMHMSLTSGTTAANFFGRVSARTSGAGFRLGVADFGNTFTDWGTDLTFGTTYLVVVKYDLVATATADIATLWINPASLGGTEPGGGITNSSSAGDVGTNIAATAGICIRNSSATPNAEIDEIRVGTTWAQVTPVPAGTPNINVTPTSLNGFISTSGVPTAAQTYTVDGSNLTNDISIVPPTGYEISTTNTPFTPTNPIPLTQTGGTVPSTTIYVRMNSATLGVNAGNITHTSTGSNNPNVAVSGNVIAAEPTTQGVISFGLITNATIDVNFTSGDGAKRILLIHALVAVNSNPADGSTYTPSTIYGAGTQIGTGNYAVYAGTGNSVTVTGLTAGTQYHFAVYEYNDGGVSGAENYLTSPLSIGDATTLSTVNTYIWSGAVNTDWQNGLNWVPDRLLPATNDSLLFVGPLTVTVTNVPIQTIGYLEVSLGSTVTLQPSAANNVLTVGNSTGIDLFVEAGSQLNISGANPLTIALPTGANALISGDMTFTGAAHKFTAVDATPLGITFDNAATFTAGAGFSSNAFGGGTTNSVVFTNGSVYNHIAGGNPFNTAGGVAQFQTGSLYRMLSNLALSLSGRTYADLEIDNAAFSQSGTGAGALSIDNLTITQGILMGVNTTGGVSIKGNVTIVPAGATLSFTPASLSTLTFNGTAAQTINNSGTFTLGPLTNLTINNAAGVSLNSSVTVGPTATLTLTSGILKLNGTNTTVTLSSGTTLAGTPSNTAFIDGKVKKIGNTAFTFPVGKTGFGYVPVEISTFVGGTTSDEFTAEYIRGNARLLGPITAGPGLDHVSGCDYWTLDKGIATPTSVDVKLYWSANNVCNGTYIDDLPSLTMAHFDGAGWNSFPVSPIITGGSTTAAGSITWPGATAFSPFSLAGATFGLNPLPIVVNYFNGTKQYGNHLLNWKVTCNSTPGVTMELLRSTDGRNFSGINTIYATALQCQQPFSYTDVHPLPGVNYYRLKMTDADGKVTYSSIVSLINAAAGIDIMNIAPNPIVNRNFKLNISAAQKTQMDMMITDMQGRVMQRQTINAIAGFNSIPVNVTNLAAGTYQVYVVSAEGRSKVLRFVIQ